MKRTVLVQFAAIYAALLCGCVAVKVSDEPRQQRYITSTESHFGSVEVDGLENVVQVRSDGSFDIRFRLNGTFPTVTIDRYTESVDANYMSFGFFPGVMSCEGEYGDSISNAAGAFYYNLVFAGLPTVYGLVVEPFVPYYPERTSSIVSRNAFLQSSLIGVSRYKKSESRNDFDARKSTSYSIPLEGAILTAPSLGLNSVVGGPLNVPRSLIPQNGIVDVVIQLPGNHPLKKAMSYIEGQTINVLCKIGE